MNASLAMSEFQDQLEMTAGRRKHAIGTSEEATGTLTVDEVRS